MNKKLLWVLGILVGIIVLLVILKKVGVFGKEEGIQVSTEKATKRTIIETVNASGKIYPEVEVKMSPDVSGEIVELNVQEGDSVRKGQQLARIYADIYHTTQSQAAAQVSQQQAVVSNSTEQLSGLKATLDQTQAQYERQKKLLDQKVISRAEYETAESAYKTAAANYSAALQNIKGGEAGVASAQAQLAIASKNLSRTTLVAPMDGVVSLLSVKKGERVVGNNMMAGTEMMRVADMSKIEAIVDVGENDIPKVHLGDSALVEVDAYNNRKFRGVVTQIASSVASATASSSAVSSNDVTNYKVHIRLSYDSYKDLFDPKRPRALVFRPGMTTSADIQTKVHTLVLSVPINAVTTRDKDSAKSKNTNVAANAPEDNSMEQPKPAATVTASDQQEVVFLLQADQKVKQVAVKTDIQDINYIEIVSGIHEGDEIVTEPYTTVSKVLQNGTQVKVVAKEKLFEAKKN